MINYVTNQDMVTDNQTGGGKSCYVEYTPAQAE